MCCKAGCQGCGAAHAPTALVRPVPKQGQARQIGRSRAAAFALARSRSLSRPRHMSTLGSMDIRALTGGRGRAGALSLSQPRPPSGLRHIASYLFLTHLRQVCAILHTGRSCNGGRSAGGPGSVDGAPQGACEQGGAPGARARGARGARVWVGGRAQEAEDGGHQQQAEGGPPRLPVCCNGDTCCVIDIGSVPMPSMLPAAGVRFSSRCCMSSSSA